MNPSSLLSRTPTLLHSVRSKGLVIPGKVCLWGRRGGEWPRVSIRIQQGCQLQESFEAFYYRETPTRVTLTMDDLRDMGLVLLLFADAAGGEF